MVVYRETFEKQIEYLTGRFLILSFQEALKMWETKSADPDERYCIVTFDDGWRDNYEHAFPVLKKYGVPATIFLPTEFIGTNRWFWPDRLGYLLNQHHGLKAKGNGLDSLSLLKKKHPWLEGSETGNKEAIIDSLIEKAKQQSPEEIEETIGELASILDLGAPEERILLNWEEVREMSCDGISFGSHTLTHRILTTLSMEEMEHEVGASFRSLKVEGVNWIPVFCYPNGNYTTAIAGVVRAAGFQAAVTTEPGWERIGEENRFALKRINIHQDVTRTIPLFTFQIAGGVRTLLQSGSRKSN
jgi:peptidoglycan/xylan/chitin deacetylase (PgdA/CDA1 family)